MLKRGVYHPSHTSRLDDLLKRIAIIRECQNGKSQSTVARDYKVSRQYVGKVIQRVKATGVL